MSEVAIKYIRPLGRQPAMAVLQISLPCTVHVEVSHLGGGLVEFVVFDPTPALLQALPEATSGACRDGKCQCYQEGECA